MCYVIHNVDASKNTIQYIRRMFRRSPLQNLASWFYNRLAGTIVQKQLEFIFTGSLLVRYAVAITIGLIIGALLDSSFRCFIPLFSKVHVTGSMTCAVLGALACYAGVGGWGLLFGFFWGWLVAGMCDSIASEVISDYLNTIPYKIVSWTLTCLVGWWVGKCAERCYDKMCDDRPRWRSYINKCILVVFFGSAAIVIYQIGVRLRFAAALAHFLFSLIAASLHFLLVHWRVLLILLTWVAVIVCTVYALMRWMMWHDRKWQEIVDAEQSGSLDFHPFVHPFIYNELPELRRLSLMPSFFDFFFECEGVLVSFSWLFVVVSAVIVTYCLI